ncbi:hypothetical protein [Cupriavidus necator]
MPYSEEQAAEFTVESKRMGVQLGELVVRCVTSAVGQPDRVAEHLQHGAGRRVTVLIRAMENLFRLFPPHTKNPLRVEDLADVQINLHAFFINLYGVFENLAWAFVLRHDLEAKIGNRLNIGLFNTKTNRYFAAPLRDYVCSQLMVTWRDNYLKSYRDALAHRIPLYVPPWVVTSVEDAAKLQQLEQRRYELIQAMDFDGVDAVIAECDTLKRVALTFVPSLSNIPKERPVYLHPQIVSDCMTLLECSKVFFDNWQHSDVA